MSYSHASLLSPHFPDASHSLPNLQQYIGDLCSSSRGPAVIPPKGGWRGVSVGYATATEGPPDAPGAIFMDEGLLECMCLY